MHGPRAVNPTRRRAASRALLALLVLVAASPAHADPRPGPWHLGVAVGALAVITDYDAGFVHPDGYRISPEPGPTWSLRLGRHLGDHLGRRLVAEAALGHAPLLLDGALGTLVTYRLDLLVALAETPITPYAVLGGGALHAFGGRDGADLDGELHYGLELRGAIRGPLALRAGLRHVFSDALDAHLTASSHIEFLVGLDVCWGE